MNVTDLRVLVTSAAITELPDIVAELEACKALVWLRLSNGATNRSGEGSNAARNQTAEQIAAALGVPESAVYDWARKDRIPSERYGRFVRFNLAEVRQALNSKTPGLGTRKKPRANGRLSASPTTDLRAEGCR